MNQRELKARIKNDPNLTGGEKAKKLREVAAPYRKLSDEELLQLVRDFVAENNRMPERCDLLYDTVLKRFGPWGRMLEKAGVKEVAQSYLDRRRRRKEKRERHKEYRRQGRPHLLIILRVKAEPYDFAAIIFAVACFEFLSL